MLVTQIFTEGFTEIKSLGNGSIVEAYQPKNKKHYRFFISIDRIHIKIKQVRVTRNICGETQYFWRTLKIK